MSSPLAPVLEVVDDGSPLRSMIGEHTVTVPLPRPPHLVVDALARLRLATSGSDVQKAEAGPVHTLPRPWVPSSCPTRLRYAVWTWLDHVAAWYNHQYAWRPDVAIPACWPAHPHLAHELAVLAFLRLEAESATSPGALEEWHRHSRPMFVSRMRDQLGPQACTKNHIAWPSASAWHEFTGRSSYEQRQKRFTLDRAPRSPDEGKRGAGYEQALPPWVDPVTGLVDEAGYAAALAVGAKKDETEKGGQA